MDKGGVEFPFGRTIKVREPISNELWEASEVIWRSRRKVTKENLSRMCDALELKVAPQNIEDMIEICDFLDMVCPMV